MARILVFGDSIVWGANDSEGGWVQRLKKQLENAEPFISVYTLGISGDSTEDVLERLDFEIEQRTKERDEIILIFAIGINDSQFHNFQKKFKVPPEKFSENLGKLLEVSKKYSSKIIFIGLTPVDDSKVNPIPWHKAFSYKNEYVKKYNTLIEAFCKKGGISFIELYEEFLAEDYKVLLDDGLHPNSKGHELIFRKVLEFLDNNRIIY